MIRLQKVTFCYPNAPRPALQDIDLEIGAGELVLVAGVSGVGKSTFLRLLNGLAPHFTGGQLSGDIRVAGQDPVAASPRLMSRTVGFVFQDPETQFVMDHVEDDLAFSLENARLGRDEIARRLEGVIARLNLAPLRRRRIDTLSGGERQRVAIAAALVHSPPILVLDEPTSQLDPGAADEVLQAVIQLHRQLGLTVLISEHRLERLLPAAGRMLYFAGDGDGDGRTGCTRVYSGPPRQVVAHLAYPPPVVTLGRHFGWRPLPLSVAEATPFAQWAAGPPSPQPAPGPNLAARESDGPMHASPCTGAPVMGTSTLPNPQSNPPQPARPALQAVGLCAAAGRTPILHHTSLDLFPGEVLALIGPNGCGKSTLLRCLTGLLRPSAGQVLLDGQEITRQPAEAICRQVGYLPQDPNSLLFADRVIDELHTTLRNHRLPPEDGWPEALLQRFGLQQVALRYPRDLSAGQRQRVALCAILVTRPRVLLLDEPTRGMDAAARLALQQLVQEWRAQGLALLLVTHDVELVAGVASRVALMAPGGSIQAGDPQAMLARLAGHAPQTMQLFPGRGWRTAEQAMRG